MTVTPIIHVQSNQCNAALLHSLVQHKCAYVVLPAPKTVLFALMDAFLRDAKAKQAYAH